MKMHHSAKPSHYDQAAEHYDCFNEENSQVTNRTVEKILKKYNVKTVLDLTCGTGSQVFWLAKRGYEVTGSDFNASMLKVAKRRAKKEKMDVKFLNGDMRTQEVGAFDAVITIFNAIGHLAKEDFEKAIQNIRKNLKDGGIYVFDINNLDYLLEGDHITELTIDWQREEWGVKMRDIQYSTIDEDGILASYTISFVQKGSGNPKMTRSAQTLQVYTAKQLKQMLRKNGFRVLEQCSIDGSKFLKGKSDRIVTVAKKE